ncbi:pentapeptide repeat-containing protein [Antarctobacter jejuensis]|uniref:pentapeptide repeat-containing protein n=1 Tax=Antarctobacter jejuensis TaxID=1439938 RepID=UPI003FD5EF96
MAGIETAAQDWITLSLPLTWTGAKVLLASMGLAVGAGLVWLMLNAPDRNDRRRDLLTDWLTALGWVLLPVWFVLLGGTLWHLWLLFSGMDSFLDNVGFGMGAVVAAFLGGPFVIWGTVLKQRTVEFQKEGHITDRISKAVEQLGAEKEISRPMRNVTYEVGKDDAKQTISALEGRDERFDPPAGATNVVRSPWEITSRTVPNIEVRIGGLLSLERIAQDSTRYDKGRDHVRVMEILCAYVRENAKAEDAVDFPLMAWEPLKDDASEEERKAHVAWRNARFRLRLNSNAREWAQSLDGPRADIALALRIIGRRTKEQLQAEARWGDEALDSADWVFDTPCPELPDPPEGESHPKGAIEDHKARLEAWKKTLSGYRGYRPDLRKTNLQKVDLSKLTLSGGRLDGARMEGANLGQARMEGANLWQARMKGANLSEARMEAAFLVDARMEGADLTQARMEAAFLVDARMEGADLTQARMEGAYLRLARMEGANLWEARMEGANLWQARMEGANLGQARMEGANLGQARMEGADLSGARMAATTDLTAAVVASAAVRSVDYSNVALSQEQVNSLFGDASVILPGGVLPGDPDWPEHWPTWELPDFGEHNFDDEWRKWQDDPENYPVPPPPEEAAG